MRLDFIARRWGARCELAIAEISGNVALPLVFMRCGLGGSSPSLLKEDPLVADYGNVQE